MKLRSWRLLGRTGRDQHDYDAAMRRTGWRCCGDRPSQHGVRDCGVPATEVVEVDGVRFALCRSCRQRSYGTTIEERVAR